MNLTATYAVRGHPWIQPASIGPGNPAVVAFHTPANLAKGGKGGHVGFAADQPGTGQITLAFQGSSRTDSGSTSISTGYGTHVLQPDTDYSFTVSSDAAQTVHVSVYPEH